MRSAVLRSPVARKKDKKDKKEARFDMRVDPAWLSRVERQAERFGLSPTAYIRQATSARLEEDERTDPNRQVK